MECTWLPEGGDWKGIPGEGTECAGAPRKEQVQHLGGTQQAGMGVTWGQSGLQSPGQVRDQATSPQAMACFSRVQGCPSLSLPGPFLAWGSKYSLSLPPTPPCNQHFLPRGSPQPPALWKVSSWPGCLDKDNSRGSPCSLQAWGPLHKDQNIGSRSRQATKLMKLVITLHLD